MIDPKELRIGNWIDSTKSGGHKFSIRDDDFYFVLKFPANYEPIELTPEWLKNMGFSEDGEGRYVNGMHEIHICPPGIVYRLPSKTLTYVKYVHQLQNLYFALTGTELVLKHTEP